MDRGSGEALARSLAVCAARDDNSAWSFVRSFLIFPKFLTFALCRMQRSTLARRDEEFVSAVRRSHGGHRPPLQEESDGAFGHPLDGEACDLPRVLQIQLFLNVAPMRLDRLRAEVQRLRDCFDFLSRPDHLEHFQLAIA
jgi:hypothetical protein